MVISIRNGVRAVPPGCRSAVSGRLVPVAGDTGSCPAPISSGSCKGRRYIPVRTIHLVVDGHAPVRFFWWAVIRAGLFVIAGSVSDVLTLLLYHYILYETILTLNHYRNVPVFPMIKHYTARHARFPIGA